MVVNKQGSRFERMTNQRLKILELMENTKSHPTAETVYVEIKKVLPVISMATVYRTLNNLAEDGRLRKLEVNKESRFDSNCHAHQHCICTHCGRIIDIFKYETSAYALKEVAVKDFVPSDIDIIYWGHCVSCKRICKNDRIGEMQDRKMQVQ